MIKQRDVSKVNLLVCLTLRPHLEAMAAGRPVVASDGAGAADCVGNCGLVVPKKDPKKLAEAIDYIKNNMTDEMIKKSQTNARNYTWDKIKRQYIELWKGLVS